MTELHGAICYDHQGQTPVKGVLVALVGYAVPGSLRVLSHQQETCNGPRRSSTHFQNVVRQTKSSIDLFVDRGSENENAY